MNRVVDILAPLGFIVMVGSAALERAGKPLPGKADYWLVAGAVLMLAHLVLRFDRILARVGRRQMKHGANTAVLVLAVAGILGVVNWLAVRSGKRWDLTKNQRFSLSDQTKKVLSGLKEDVRLLYFQRKAELPAAQDRLKEFQATASRLKIDYVDPVADPARAREYEITMVPTLVFERGSKREKATGDSEQDVVNALIKVTRDTKKTICFAEGEGERDIDDGSDRGYTAAKGALSRSQYEVKKVLLMREGKVPETCTVLVVSGPEKDLLPVAVDAIRAHVKGGGKALVMVEPELKEPYPNLVGLLKEWNVDAGKDVVVDISPMGQLFGTGPLTPLAARYPFHEITKDFRVATAFHTARTLTAGTAAATGVSAQTLVETSEASWAESDLTLKEPVKMNEGADRAGPVALGVVVTVQAAAAPAPTPSPASSPSPAEEPARPKEGRVVAFGDADFASNALLSFQGNQDFFLNTVAWLAEDADLISIRPKEPDDQRLFLTAGQQSLVTWLSLVVVPGLFVVLGVAAWWRNRG